MSRTKIKYLKISQAAEFLGISEATLRSWDRLKKLRPFRNKKNGYRLYRISLLRKFREKHKLRKYIKSVLA